MARKVAAGDSFPGPSAAMHNATLDLIRERANRQHDLMAGDYAAARIGGIVLAANESGSDRERFDILGIDCPIVGPAENEGEFVSRVTVRGVLPAELHRGRFVVLQEALPVGAIGRAVISGPCVVRVWMGSEAHRRADVMLGMPGMLASNASGSALLSWVQPVDERDHPEIAWAVAIIGSPGTPPARAKVTRYSDDYTHYMGKLIDADDEEIDPDGPDVDLWCRKGVPDNETDIRLYLPRLRATGYTDKIWDVRWSVEGGGRWFIDTFFVPWCEAEGVPGTVPTLPFPQPPGEPQVPGDSRALEERWRP